MTGSSALAGGSDAALGAEPEQPRPASQSRALAEPVGAIPDLLSRAHVASGHEIASTRHQGERRV
jgi:hypothetical protein